MLHQTKKVLCYTIITALLNSTTQPLYAVHTHHNELEEDLSVEKHPRPRLLVLEDALQEKIKTSATGIQAWTPDFIKEPVSRVYKGLCSWLGTQIMDLSSSVLAKTPLEIDYAHDLDFWRAHFTKEIQDLKNSVPNQERLQELQDIVWNGLLSPHHYEEELRELKEHGPASLLDPIQDQFHSTLKKSPALLRDYFQRDLFASLEGVCRSEKGIEDFEDLLTYYRKLQNPLDYTHSLVDFRRFIQRNKQVLHLTDPKYWDLNKATANAIKQRDQAEYRILKAEHQGVSSAFQELPYPDADDVENAFNAALPQVSNQGIITENSSSFMTPLKGLTQLAYKGMKYALDHPVQAITIGLVSQVAATAALNAFKAPTSKTSEGKLYPLDDESPEQVPQKQAIADEKSLFQKEPSEQPSPLLSPRYAKRTIGDEFQINQNTTSIQQFPSVASLTNGNIFVAWGNNYNGLNNYGRAFTANGTAQSDEFGINQSPTSYQLLPFIAGLTNGNAFVAWQGSQTGDYDIYGRIFSANGTTLSNEFGINQVTISEQVWPSVTSLTDGNVFVAWAGAQTGNYDIYGRVFTANGTALSNDFGINQNTILDQYSPSLASLSDGNVFVAWEGDQTGNWDIYGRIFHANGTALSNEFGINQNITSNQQERALSVTGLTNGNVFVAWVGHQTGHDGVYGRVFFPNGTALSNEFGINQVTAGNQQYPSVAKLANGNIFVAWDGDQTGNDNIYGRILPNETLASLILPSTTGTTGMTTTGFNAVTAMTELVVTTLANSHSSSPSSSDIPIIIGAAVGGAAVLGGSGLAYYLYKCSKHSSLESERNDDIELEKRKSNVNPFAATSVGYTTHPTVVGAINNRTYEIWKEISSEEANLIQPHIAKEIPSSTFILGRGQFGVIYVGSEVGKNELYAIKEVHGKDAVQESQREGELQNELKDCPHVMSLIDYRSFEPVGLNDEPRLFQVMPLAYTNGVGYRQMLSPLRMNNPILHEELVVDNFQQLMKGLAYMHDKEIYHLDIKDENILYMLDGTLRIGDLGRARKLGTQDQIVDHRLGDRRKFSPEQFAFIRHTWKQQGKEVGTGETADSFPAWAADTWAGGLYTFELLFQDGPLRESTAPYETKVTSWTNATFQRALDTIQILQQEPLTSFKGMLRGVLAVNFKERLKPVQTLKGFFSSQSPSSEKRAQAFRRLITLHESERKELKSTEVSSGGDATLYYSTKPKEGNENYRYDSNPPSDITVTSNKNHKSKKENKNYN